MSHPKPLFIMGSKRSGSSFLVNVLNLHPWVFVSHESDVVWILYQIYKDDPDRFRTYPFDEGKGMWATLNECSEILRSIPSDTSDKKTVFKMFYRLQMYINEHGRGNWDRHILRKKNLAWIGDKKPVQHSDPEIQSFLNVLFPEARNIHLIRDPRSVVASMIEAGKTWNDQSIPEYWKQTPSQILERWAIHEEWVLRAKSRLLNKIRTIRLEDLAEDPVRIMSETFSFLDLDLPSDVEKTIADWVWRNPNWRHRAFDLPVSPRACRVMQNYRYAD